MKKYLTKTPSIIQQIFKNYTWHFSLAKKEIYLTFDDGPTPKITKFVINELQKHNAKATFFCIGKNIENHPKIFREIISEGHSVGNHTQNHFNGWKTEKANYINNVLQVEKTIEFLNLKAFKPNLFRPPYGKIKRKQARKLRDLGYRIIMWDVLSADFDTSITKEKCLENVIKNTTNGSVVVFHDSIKAFEKLKYTLPKVLEYYSEKGFTFKAIT